MPRDENGNFRCVTRQEVRQLLEALIDKTENDEYDRFVIDSLCLVSVRARRVLGQGGLTRLTPAILLEMKASWPEWQQWDLDRLCEFLYARLDSSLLETDYTIKPY